MEGSPSLTAKDTNTPMDGATTTVEREAPPAYSEVATVVPQVAAQEATVVPQVAAQEATVLTHQPRPSWNDRADMNQRRSELVAADNMYRVSIFLCIVCCLCGSPLTLACFIPAIILASKVWLPS